MDAYCSEIRKLEGKFYGIEYHHVVQDQNQAVDHLSKLGSTISEVSASIFIQDLQTPSFKQEQAIHESSPIEQLVLVIPTLNSDWREPFIKYLTTADVLADKTKMDHLICHSKHYMLVNGKLMRKNAKEELLQKYISQEEGVALLQEINARSYGNHAASRSLVGKAF